MPMSDLMIFSQSQAAAVLPQLRQNNASSKGAMHIAQWIDAHSQSSKTEKSYLAD